MNDNKQLPVKFTAKELDLKFPDNKLLTKDEQSKINKAVKGGGIVASDGRGFFDANVLPDLLSTDKKGAAKVIVNATDEDILKNGNDKYLSMSATKKEIDKRIQEPRNMLKIEKLKHSEKCINTFRDAPELEKERQIEANRITEERSTLTNKKIKAENITACQLSGDKFNNDARGHHIKRVEDEPREARNLNNIVVVKENIHKDIHVCGAESPEELITYAKSHDYSIPDNLKG